MEIQIFTLPLLPQPEQLEELNHFLRSHRVVDIRKEMAMADGGNVWTFCITYLQATTNSVFGQARTGKIDYKDVLDEDAFKRFSVLRKIRKSIADEEAVPAYAVFTDAELAELSKQEMLTPETMQAVPGIGKKKIEKYASRIVLEYNKMKDETGGLSH